MPTKILPFTFSEPMTAVAVFLTATSAATNIFRVLFNTHEFVLNDQHLLNKVQLG